MKTTHISNYRVEVETDTTFIFEKDKEKIHQIMIRRSDDMVGEIKRHIDGFEGVQACYDTEYVCEHCGAAWTEESETYNGGCCAPDIDAEALLEELEKQK